MKIFSSILLPVLCLVSVSCGKDNSSTPTETKTDLLTASAWVHESSGADLTGDGNVDVPLPTLPTCLVDNVLTFKKDGTAVADEGASKCNDADPPSTSFNWSFADNESSLVIDNNVFSALNGKLKIKTLTATNFTLAKDTIVGGMSATVIVNLKH